MLSALSKIDDLEKKWPTQELLIALGFPVRARNALPLDYREGADEISLKEVMELVISDDDKDPRPGYIISRLLGYKNMGTKSFWSVIERLNTIDLGKKCNTFWKLKYEKLMNAYRVKGKCDFCWSIPTSEKGKGYVIQSCKKDLTPPEGWNKKI